MKRLYLLRHAQAQSSASEDKLRKLTETGERQADLLGAHMQAEDYYPGGVLCSPATRTRETLEGIAGHLGMVVAEFPDALFYASPGDLINFIHAYDNSADSLLLVNHNPAIHQLAFMLTGDGPDHKIQELAVMYKPGTLTVLDCPIDRWADLMPGQNTLVELTGPLA